MDAVAASAGTLGGGAVFEAALGLVSTFSGAVCPAAGAPASEASADASLESELEEEELDSSSSCSSSFFLAPRFLASA